MITKIKDSINRLQVGLTADQTQQKRGFINQKIGQKTNQIEAEEKRVNTHIDTYTKRQKERKEQKRHQEKNMYGI